MSLGGVLDGLDLERVGRDMHDLMKDLFPMCRSITGDGFRETLATIEKRVPIDVHEVPTGTPAFDWTVPKEWNVREAYVANGRGERVIDLRRSSLHLVSYSTPVRRAMSLSDLRAHLHTLPERPDWIPYRTSYYEPEWGFCLSERQLSALDEAEYHVVVDSSLEDGSLTYGEYFLEGDTDEEVLISCHACHPSMANDNLSGVALVTFLAERIAEASPRYSYRFLFVPGTIGSITWLSMNEDVVPRIRHGLVAACVGDPGPLTYQRSQRGDADIDRAAAHVVGRRGGRVREFSPYGYDERQYNSPGFNLPVGCLSRTPHGEFPEYHTSADGLDFVRPDALADSLEAYLEVFTALEENGTFANLFPKGEPQLGRRGLYPSIGGKEADAEVLAMLWVLNQSDGNRTLLDIADRAGIDFRSIRRAASSLLAAGLLRAVLDSSST